MKFNKELWEAHVKGELMGIRRSRTVFYVAMLSGGRDARRADAVPLTHTATYKEETLTPHNGKLRTWQQTHSNKYTTIICH